MRLHLRRISVALAAAAIAATALVAVAAPTSAAGPTGYTIVSNDFPDCQLAVVDVASGATTVLPATSGDACVTDLAVAPDGTVYGIRAPLIGALDVDLVRFDTTTGAATIVGPFTGNFTDSFMARGGLAFDANGNLLSQIVTDEPGCDGDFVCLYRTDPATGASTFVGNSGLLTTSLAYLAADCAGSLLTTSQSLAASVPGATDAPAADPPAADANAWGDAGALQFEAELAPVNPATGAVSSSGPAFPGDFDLAGLDYDKATGTLYAIGAFGTPPAPVSAATTGAGIYTVDPSTAALTLVAPLSDPSLDVFPFAIAGTCASPAVVLQPRFTG